MTVHIYRLLESRIRDRDADEPNSEQLMSDHRKYLHDQLGLAEGAEQAKAHLSPKSPRPGMM